MYKEKIKNSILVGLIVLCVLQTAMLWLGDSSSLNFLQKTTNTSSKLSPIYPEATWVTLGEGTLAYQVESTTEYTSGQYERLTSELQNILIENIKPTGLVYMPTVNWGELLSLKGIWYEYALPVTIDELLGAKTDAFKDHEKIDHVFLRPSETSGSAGQVFLINTKKNKGYQANVKGNLRDLSKIIEAFANNQSDEGITYQATITSNVKSYVENNTFVPATVPLEYDLLRIYHPIDQEGDERVGQLEEYVDSFFDNPLIKKIEQQGDGSIVLSETKKTMMVYKPNGMVEYVNVAPNRNEGKMTRIDGYNVALAFVTETRGISGSLKKHLYLTDIEQNGQEYTYRFDMMYNGYKVRLGETLMNQLGTKSLVEVTVKNHQIMSGKWLLVEVEKPTEYAPVPRRILEVGYTESVDKMLEVMHTTTPGMIAFEAIECVYVMNSIEGDVSMQWGVKYEDQWYYPQ